MRKDRFPSPAGASLTDLLVEQRAGWERGERIPAEAYLRRHPALASDGDAVLDLIGNEMLLRQERGERPGLDEYLRRFPQWTAQIKVQFEVERAIEMETPSPSAQRSMPATIPMPSVLAAVSPSIPGYEVLDELGRGGQSVVFRARQLALDRLVALKMILGSAGPEERARFQREVEAVAHLEHPHIAQVYDVGEQAGQPYCALEYVAGGTLARKLAGVPQPAAEAAGIIEVLARTMHWAHQRGIVHRDLKPGNVLMTADGTPKITDFGLAKRLEASASLTHAGHVIGTPSYMAPEQAAGKSKEVGPAADVYALGTILYEMLTGRPPFLGTAPWEILPQVVAFEPVPPSRLQPKVPADLETICLKCLEKEPHRRYASGEALAEDLRRFQAGQPIRARPVGWAERAAKWVKRRPVVAGLTAAVVAAVLAGLVASLALAAWALRERDRARDRLQEAQKANRSRVQAQVEQLGSAAPEAVPGLLVALAEDRDAVRPRLRELWADETGIRQRRMRAGLALLEDPAVKEALTAWLIEADDPREVLLVREVLTPHGAGLARCLWEKVDDPKTPTDIRFRALVGLAAFDPANPRWRRAAPAVVDQLVWANPLFLGLWVRALRPVRDHLRDPLTDVFRGKHLADRRLVAADVLADYAADRPAVLADLACDADAEQFALLRPAMEKNGGDVRTTLTAELAKGPPAEEPEADRIARAKRQANAAAALLVLGDASAAWPLLGHSQKPDARTCLIHALAPRGADARVLVRRLEEEKDDCSRAALILALGEYSASQLPEEVRAALTAKLLSWYRDDPDPGVHGAIDWLLRHGQEGPAARPLDWGGRKALEAIDADLAGRPGRAGRRWFVNGQGQTFTAVRGPVEVLMGSPDDELGRTEFEGMHRRTIGRSFALAARPVTVAEWEKFIKAMKEAKRDVPLFYWKNYAPEPDCPILCVSWCSAAMYCRWLSELENVPKEQMVYPSIDEILKCADGQAPLKLPADHLSRTGYRLPTEAEFEYACRAGTATPWYCGGAEEFLPRHAWFLKNSENRTWPAGQKKPNELGLFDMLGNAWTWCQDGCRPDPDAGTEDTEDNRDIKDSLTRMLRGGSFLYQAREVRAAFREHDRPTYGGLTVGFRLARTLPPAHFTASRSRP